MITAGCSYSQVPNRDTAWPAPLNEHLNPETVLYLGQGAAGNGIISRKVIYNTTEMLKKYKPEEILVGIMWSGCDRGETYSLNPINTTIIEYGVANYRNPMSVIGNNNKHYYLTNGCWDDDRSQNAKKYMIPEDRVLNTLEHILRTQWFLKLHNISYFMTEYDYDCFTTYCAKDLNLTQKGKDLKFLWDQIDWEYWLPINNCLEWVTLKSGFKHARPGDDHPSTEQHRALVERIILPFLLEKKLINDTI